MSDDIVKRLHYEAEITGRKTPLAAADEIERLRAEIAAKDAALEDIKSFSSRIFGDPHRALAAVHEKAAKALKPEETKG